MTVGLVMLLGGLGLRAWALKTLLAAGLTHAEILEVALPKTYTADGPYRWLDHPAYVGSLLVIAGAGVMALGPGGAVLALAAWPFFASRIHGENRLRGCGWL